MAIPELDLKKVNLQAAVGYLISLHDNEVDWNLLGIKVIGVIDALPIPEGTYEYGDAYMVGTETPYDMYIYTRPDGKVHTEGYWFPIGKFPMPGPQGPKGDGVETFTNISLTHDIYSGDVYGSNNGQTYNGRSTIQYKDSTTGQTKSQDIYTTVFLPIVGSDYINIDGDAANSRFVVRIDDTALAQDYWKINKTVDSAVPLYQNGKTETIRAVIAAQPSTLARRDANGNSNFTKLFVNRLATTAGEYDMPLQAAYYGGFSDGFTVEKTPTDTGTLSAEILSVFRAYPNAKLKYNNQSYIGMDPTSAPDGTLNFIHIDSIEDGNGGYKATGKCFSITVSTREWKVVDLDFGGSTRTTHNLTLTNSSTGMSIYFSLTNNRPETYEGAPAGLLAALENSQIACTVDANGTYSAGMITVDGDNFKVTYGNGEEALIEQMQVSITDSVV